MRNRHIHNPVVVEELVQFVTFRVGGEEFGLDINAITEVLRPLKVTPLPGCRISLKG